METFYEIGFRFLNLRAEKACLSQIISSEGDYFVFARGQVFATELINLLQSKPVYAS